MTTKLWDLEARENDGSGNNQTNDAWGQANTILLRDFVGAPGGETPPLYADGVQAPRLYPVTSGFAPGTGKITDLANFPTAPIDFIDETVRTEANVPNSYGVNELSAFYGQFITHDMTASAIPVPIPGLTPLFPGALSNGTPADDLLGLINRTPGAIVDGQLEQRNGVTHYLDLSLVYGSGGVLPTTGAPTTVNDALRVKTGSVVDQAKLIAGANGGLPTLGEVLAANPGAIAAAWGPALGAFTGDPNTLVAGDARVAQQPFLAAIHSVWLKEHNYQVDQLAAKYAPQITSGEIDSHELFDMARTIAEAEHQHIIYEEYLAAILGKDAVKSALQFTGYDDAANAGIRNLFTTVAFRFGHDQQSDAIQLLNADGTPAVGPAIPPVGGPGAPPSSNPLDLAQAFLVTTAQLNSAGGLEEVLRGLQVQKAQEIDGKLVPSLIDNVLGIPGLNLNLGLLDNVRAADHGIGTLNQVREQLGLAKYTSFSQLTSDPVVQAKLLEYYGHIDNVDPWIGGLLEKHVPGSQLGETFQAIIIEQFKATMAGDRFYYEERLKDYPELIAEIKGVTFAEIADRNSGTDHSHLHSFNVAKKIEGTYKNDKLYGADHADYLKADLLIGGDGNDSIYGKYGDDTLYGDNGNDTLDGGWGDDWLVAGYGNDTVYGGWGDDHAKGEAGNDKLFLEGGDDWADGGDGNDTVFAGDGNDIVLGHAGNDTLFGDKGNDKLFGGYGKDAVYGGSGDDYAYGGADADTIFGEHGNDWIFGEGGNDTMWGGQGYDTFVFAKGSGKDKILDFRYGDKIDLTALTQFDSIYDLNITSKYGVTTINLGDTDYDGKADTIELIGVYKLTEYDFKFASPIPV